MDRKQFLKLAPERRMVMTFALRQALEILQMPQIELAQWLRSEIEKNPLLELTEYSTKPRFDAEIPASITLHEHIARQIRENFTCPRERSAAEKLHELLDERGFLDPNIQLKEHEEKILPILQTFDPPGIFARSLQESLLIQLRGKEKSLCYKLVQNCFDDLLHGRYGAIKKKLNTPEIGAAVQILSRLSMRPANIFQQDPVTPAIPDLYIEKIDGGWTLSLTEDELPKFHIQNEYLNLELDTVEEIEHVRGLKTQAKWIMRSLNRRRKLLKEIGRIILIKQARYLDEKGPLAQLSIKELAEKLEIHESTLSRALNGKYISTPRGILAMRSLVSSTPTTETARELLEKLVNAEDKRNPLTDDQIAKELKAKGYPVARRTISKYRGQLKIGSATQRRNLSNSDRA